MGRTTFLNRAWQDRSTLEQGAIILGTILLTKKAYDKFAEPGLNSYLHPPGETAGVRNDPRPLIDTIAEETIGWNYSYEPEIINQLTDLTPEELKIGYNYWQQKYRGKAGGSLTKALKGEYAQAYPGGPSYFQPAIDWLEYNSLF
jgi:hypothetical protein